MVFHQTTNSNKEQQNHSKKKETNPPKVKKQQQKQQNAFTKLNLSLPLLKGISKMHYKEPTPVQRRTIPQALSGKDMAIMARTGSGKTVAFLVPLLERLLKRVAAKALQAASIDNNSNYNGVGAVIISPTRELSLQTLRVLNKLGMYCGYNADMGGSDDDKYDENGNEIVGYGNTNSHNNNNPAFQQFNYIGINGGESMVAQFEQLSSNPNVIIGTPGRLAHHLNEIPDFHLNDVCFVVFDEADRLFESGMFVEDIRLICKKLPAGGEERQTMLVSATMPQGLLEFARSGILNGSSNMGGDFSDRLEVVRLESERKVSDDLRMAFVCTRGGVGSDEKDAALLFLLRDVLTRIPVMGATGSTAAAVVDDEDTANAIALAAEEFKISKDDDDATKKEKKKKKKKMLKQIAASQQKQRPKSAIGLTLIFAATRHHVDYLVTLINSSNVLPASFSTPNSKTKSMSTSLTTSSTITAIGAYGTMDTIARQNALRLFSSSRVPILVVTDLAARGLDVPYVDHVIHHSFPPDPKLFIHRSGRVARVQGRIGYSWTICGGFDELPYMVDLFQFLKLDLGNNNGNRTNDKDVNDDTNTATTTTTADDTIYAPAQMIPEIVRYGSVPESILVEEVENVRRIIDCELGGFRPDPILSSLNKDDDDDERKDGSSSRNNSGGGGKSKNDGSGAIVEGFDARELKALARVCANATKQYIRTRPEATRFGCRKAKDILEGSRDGHGRRSFNDNNDDDDDGTTNDNDNAKQDKKTRNNMFGGIPPHPVLKWVEREKRRDMIIARRRKENIVSEDEQQLGSNNNGTKSKNKKKNIAKNDDDFDNDVEIELKKTEDLAHQREIFLRAIHNHRPIETVFEAFSRKGGISGGGGGGVMSQIDKGRTTPSLNKVGSILSESASLAGGGGKVSGAGTASKNSKTLMAVKQMRRQMKIFRNGKAQFVAGSGGNNSTATAATTTKDGTTEDMDIDVDENNTITQRVNSVASMNTNVTSKGGRRISKAERRKAKKGGTTITARPTSARDDTTPVASNEDGVRVSRATIIGGAATIQSTKSKDRRGSDFRDSIHYIDDGHRGPTNGSSNSNTNDDGGMTDTVGDNDRGSGRTKESLRKLEEATFEMMGEDGAEMARKQRLMRWDKSKRKYVRSTVGEEISGISKSKKIRLESGATKKNGKGGVVGELYEKWRAKTNKSIGRVGVFDGDGVVGIDNNYTEERGDVAEGGSRGGVGGKGSTPRPKKGGKGGKGGNGRRKDGADDVDTAGVRSLKEVGKSRKEKAKTMSKNGGRPDDKKKKKKGEGLEYDPSNGGKGYQGKKGFSGRYNKGGGKNKKGGRS